MEPLLGMIVQFGGNFAPRNWAFCDGQLLPIASNSALYSLLGTTYGGDGYTTFALPDLRGRLAIHPGHGPGLSGYTIGQKGGSETNTLTSMQIPVHYHTPVKGKLKVNSAAATTDEPEGFTFAKGTGTDSSGDPVTITGYSTTKNAVTQDPAFKMSETDYTGEGKKVPNRQPSLCVNFIISLAGVFPSRE